ncbi:hypothetical protein FJ987_16520 [Mesorhizobium sp. CU2]|uniref:hypothetical protein n=1 Tax=unclassified Mesorhizobium TaxID=325217 RepID=UPI00112DA9D1|nr:MULTISPECIES: hypothetical protein [unclassified Mesorhizobium]TPN82571.1 hypothetical protein FJ988_15570 [Mesorhizobium sp. CU3]TPO12776.1 hypothetical protein FJ987_16520 [Mesorhizobium sp. CU2]
MVDRISIRMYRVGFGDCFLLTFWFGQTPKRVLFDCGSLSKTKAQVAKIADDVVATCTSNDRAALDLVVCTHRHKDHVSGFDNPIWRTVEVGEVWMPWTEDPADPDATRIRNRQSAFAMALSQAISPGVSADLTPLARNSARTIKNAQLALALNSLTNEQAMATLHRGFAGNPPRRFFPARPGDNAAAPSLQTYALTSLPGVQFHILGPSRDEKVIANMDPPAGAAYIAQSNAMPAQSDASAGCEQIWQIGEALFRQQTPGSTFNDEDRIAVEKIAEDPDFSVLAAAIDNAVNNTSLMIMIEAGNQFLLFPGDAQWGTWKAAMDQVEVRELLARTTILKVSHHGSHNGTPKELIESLIGSNVTAFVSTGTVTQWPGIPRGPLMAALNQKTKLARSDVATPPAGFTVKRDLYVEWETAT